MIWFPLALLSAFSWATADYLTKRWFSPYGAWQMAFLRHLFSLPFLWSLLPFCPALHPSPGFWATVGILLPVEVLATVLYMEAIRSSPLSLTLPFLSFTPIFLVLPGVWILGERPGSWGLLGIGLVALGGYLLNLGGGLWGPFVAIGRERGSWMMLVVAGLYAWTSALGKKALLLSHPFFFGPLYVTLLTLCLGLGAGGKGLKAAPIGRCLALGGMMALMFLSHWISIILVEASYMIAVKRTSPLFGVLYGGLALGEGDFRRRFLATALMVVGVVIIGVLG